MIKCTLDEDDCINLLTVLRVVNQIDQEQAWALCYGMADLMKRLLPLGNCAPIDNLAQIQLHKDGFIHEKSCLILNTRESKSHHNHNHNHNNNHHHNHHHTISSSNSASSPTSPSSTTSTSSSPTEHLHSSSPSLLSSSQLTTDSGQSQHQSQLEQQKLSTATTTTTKHTSQPQPQPQPHSPPTPPITPELNELLRRRPALNEYELVASLGIALFWALDYGIPNDEERKLNRSMECLIFQSQNKLSLNEVLELCIDRLPIATKSQANSHYRGVCKTLVGDTIELSMFLEKIYTASMVLSDITLNKCLDNNLKCDISAHGDEDDVDVGDLSELGEPLASLRALRINDWARLWMQVIRELRQRGKFKQALLVN